jgi:HK97 family phage prohead protease
MTPRVEVKSFELEIKDADSNGMIRGYASTFGNIDQGLDVVDKGAFKKSIKESKGLFPILADHNPANQIGWNLRAEEDDKGLFVEGKLDLNVQAAREKYSLAKTAMEAGAKMGLSIGYMTIKAEPDRTQPSVRRLKELKLFEYSIVTFPMNTSAMITSMKADFDKIRNVDSIKKLITELKQHGITHSDLLLALQDEGAAYAEFDPTIGQSLQQLIATMRA